MKITISKDEILEIINEHFGSTSAGFAKDGTIIIDETLEKLLSNEEDIENDLSYMMNPYYNSIRQKSILQRIYKK